MRSPKIAVAVIVGTVSYALMNLVMTSSPLAVVGCGFAKSNAADVVTAHVLAMYAPSFFTGHIIARFGVERVMAVGLVILAGAGVVAFSGVTLPHFFAALILLGLGWNFLFTGSTTLALTAYRPEEKDKAQGALNFCVFAVLALSSLASGVLVTTRGWSLLNLGSLLPLGMTALLLGWLALSQRKLQNR